MKMIKLQATENMNINGNSKHYRINFRPEMVENINWNYNTVNIHMASGRSHRLVFKYSDAGCDEARKFAENLVNDLDNLSE